MATRIYNIGQSPNTAASLRITRAERSIVTGDSRNNVITIAPSTTVDDEGDFIDGQGGDDVITAGNTNDELFGGGGNDVVRGNGGNDLIDGGSGNDTLDGGDGDDVVVGGTGNDVVKGAKGNDSLHGGDGDDIVDGGDGHDVMSGGNGTDTLIGGFGDDTMDGGDGADTLVASFGNDTLTGGLGDDFLDGGSGHDTLDGGDGDDDVLGGSGDDTLRGGAGADFIVGADGNDVIEGGDGADDLNGGSGDDAISAGAGDDSAIGGAGNDIMNGDDGNDTLMGGDGADAFNGGTGDDMLISGRPDFDPLTGTFIAFDTFDGGAGTDTVDLSGYGSVDTRLLTIIGVENITTGSGNDVIFGDDNANTLNSGAGDDTIDGRGGNDLLIGGAGADLLIGNSGFDTADLSASATGVTVTLAANTLDPTIAGAGSGGDAEGDRYILVERFLGSAFADTFNGDDLANWFVGAAGADTLNGGGGVDTAEYSTSAAGVAVNLSIVDAQFGAGGDAEGDVLSNVENVIGSTHADTLIGDAEANRLEGGDGNDLLRGGLGADMLIGGIGFDTSDYSDATLGIVIQGQNITVEGILQPALLQVVGGAAVDIMLGIERVVGSAFNDQMSGGSALNIDNVFEGGGGNDVLNGGAGNDILFGGAGADQLFGGVGSDTVDYSASATGITILGATVNVGGVPTPGFVGQMTGGIATEATGDLLLDIETVIGTAFNDVLGGNVVANILRGGAGDDLILGGGGPDILDGGDGNDLLDYSTSALGVSVNLATATASGGDATGDVIANFEAVRGSSQIDVLIGNAVDNQLLGGGGADTLVGGDGNDTMIGGAGADAMLGEIGVDTADYSSSSLGVTLAAASSGGQPIAFVGQTTAGVTTDATGDVLINIENIIGSALNDSIGGNILANTLQGGAGVDTLNYAASAAGVAVNLSTNTVSGGYATGDVISGFENVIGSGLADALTGDDLGNTIRGGAGADVLDGGLGLDTLDYSTSNAAVSVNLATNIVTGGHASGDIISNFENVIGSVLGDLLIGDIGNNVFVGGAGGDQMIGGAGVDTADYSGSTLGVTLLSANIGGQPAGTGFAGIANAGGTTSDATADILLDVENIIGSAFDDSIAGNALVNNLLGGAGIDMLSYAASTAAISVNLSTNAVSGGYAAGDVISGFENVTGSALNDVLTGTTTDNVFIGGAGADQFIGGAGIDTASYATSTAGVTVQLNSNAATLANGGTTGGDATGDLFNTIENVIGSAFTDDLRGTTGDNKLVSGASGATREFLRGGSGADLLVANGLTAGGVDLLTAFNAARVLQGEGLGDGGIAGIDTFRILDGFNVISGWVAGERIELDQALAQSGRVNLGTTAYVRLDTDTSAGNGGTSTETWVIVGSNAMDDATFTTALTSVLSNVFVDPLFIA